MTKTVLITDLSEVKSIKISCNCGAQWLIPIGNTLSPKQCFKCGRNLQYIAINQAVAGIAAISEASKQSEFTAEIETEEEKT